MRKLFGNKRKKSIDGNLKIPVPMISGIEYADLPESQISTIISGYAKKSGSSKPSSLIEKTPQIHQQLHRPIVPSRSMSSPPILLMPKPHYSLPPTRSILKNIDFEKTQIEPSSISSDSEEDEDRCIKEIYPSNIVVTSKPNTIKRSVLVQANEKNTTNQSITRTSDDSSSRQYISASQSPFFTASSVVSNSVKMNSSQQEFVLTPSTSTNTSNLDQTSLHAMDFPKPPSTLPVSIMKEKDDDEEEVIRKKPNSSTLSIGSTLTVGHDVTHTIPPENKSSESSASSFILLQTMSQPDTSIQELLQRELKKMALDKDVQELKRAVDKLQQDRLLDLQESAARYEKQKLTEIEMWEHINMANEKLTKWIEETTVSTKKKQPEEEQAPRQQRPKHKKSFRLMNDYFPPDFDMAQQQYYYHHHPPYYHNDIRFPYHRQQRSSRSMDPPPWIIPPNEHNSNEPTRFSDIPPPRNLSRKSSFHSAKSDEDNEQQQHIGPDINNNDTRHHPHGRYHRPPPLDPPSVRPYGYNNNDYFISPSRIVVLDKQQQQPMWATTPFWNYPIPQNQQDHKKPKDGSLIRRNNGKLPYPMYPDF